MFDTLYCHIGSQKTGTTSIQMTFATSQPQLHAAGVHFVEKRAGLLAHVAADPVRVVRGLVESRDADGLAKFIRNARNGLRKAATEGLATAVFSSEDSLSLRAPEVAALGDLFAAVARRTVVVFYARHPYSRVPSLRVQAIKTGHARIGDPLAPLVENYERALAPWIARFGLENVVVRPFEIDAMPHRDPVGDLCAVIDAPALYASLDVQRQNDSLTLPAVLIADAMNARGRTQVPRREIIEVLQAIRGPKFALPPDAIRALDPVIAPNLDYLRRTFGVDLQTPRLPDHVSDRNLAFSDDTLASIGARLHTLATEISALEKTLKARQDALAALRGNGKARRDQPPG